jgi:hypothetical protein
MINDDLVIPKLKKLVYPNFRALFIFEIIKISINIKEGLLRVRFYLIITVSWCF